MNTISPKKLLNSKWTAVTARNKEKHFLVMEVEYDEQGLVIYCLIEAVMTSRSTVIDWQELKNDELWAIGWQ